MKAKAVPGETATAASRASGVLYVILPGMWADIGVSQVVVQLGGLCQACFEMLRASGAADMAYYYVPGTQHFLYVLPRYRPTLKYTVHAVIHQLHRLLSLCMSMGAIYLVRAPAVVRRPAGQTPSWRVQPLLTKLPPQDDHPRQRQAGHHVIAKSDDPAE